MKRIFSRDERNEQRRAEREAWHQRQVGGMAPMKPLVPPTEAELRAAEQLRTARQLSRPLTPYPSHCIHPEKCEGRTYCPRDPICID